MFSVWMRALYRRILGLRPGAGTCNPIITGFRQWAVNTKGEIAFVEVIKAKSREEAFMLTRTYRFHIATAAAILTSLLAISIAVAATPIVSYFEPNPAPWSEFGTTVIGMNHWVIVGAPKRSIDLHTGAGRVLVYQEANAWHRCTIDNPNPTEDARFGFALAPFTTGEPTKFIVGTPFDDDGARDAGIVYVYSVTGSRVLTIHNPDPDVGDHFGAAVAFVHPNMILVGAPGENSSRGIAYLFNATTGALLQTLQNPDPDYNDFFGWTVSGASTAIVSAPEDDLGGTDAGTVYVFDPSNGNLLLTLQNPAPARGVGGSDSFGKALSGYFSPNFAFNILVGAPGEDAGGTDIGAAYAFDGTTGDLVRTFNNPDPDDGDVFGTAVQGRGATQVLVSAKFDDTQAQDAGAAYLFNATNGNYIDAFYKQSAVAVDELGNALGLGEAGFLVGVYKDDVMNEGGVYLFQFDPGPEISVHGNNYIIRRGDTTPASSDGTYFGHVNVNGGRVTHEFTILNIGSETLSLTGKPRVQIERDNASAFSVVLVPSGTVAALGGTTTFRIRFDPSSTGAVLVTTVTIKNNDSSEGTYSFRISGIGDR